MADDEYNRNSEDDEAIIHPLTEDNDTPFSPPTDSVNDMTDSADREAESTIDPTHQSLDTNIDPHEMYDEGLSGAAEAGEPNAGSAVEGYDPANDSRKK